jgi:Cu(I)/Ag(I) efflux system membrane protein CusA/SilA
MTVGGMAITLVYVFIIPCLTAWHKEYKFMNALKKDPNTSGTGIYV